MIPFIQIGGVRIWTYGLMMGLAFVAGYLLGERQARRFGVPIPMSIFIPGLIAGGLLFGRLDHLLVVEMLAEHRTLASMSWSSFFTAGYTYFGGLLGGSITFVACSRYYRVPMLKMLDGGAPIVSLCYAVGRIGCFLAGDGDYGQPTSLPWGMSFPHGVVPTVVRVHPSMLYESAYALVIFLILWPRCRPENYARLQHGAIFTDMLLWTGICRFLFAFTSRNYKFFAGLTEAQLVSIGFVLAALLVKLYLRYQASHASSSLDVPSRPPSAAVAPASAGS